MLMNVIMRGILYPDDAIVIDDVSGESIIARARKSKISK
jgi:hypothetical protein